ncbi:uncharacterized protein LOC110228955 isoform X1 [Arabidopsis lyrata subsp. lyrata]|uniref:uncharacterized protein LOC110228954 isoform X1 n=2 Tax=Arabidopsis lyrata subsp. lyrata TaxID=81972 RepID=UPI000A29A5B4|nr:uncharacterized protein LOC110228954 isoform X1 [Arabidopsis lyrata subsp. lyrata]XP_020883074.1 uncharacterized protein LOC110228954 isoform X1 [Arabidopsis lyrata subsp. lyrata]XP_020883076.1 uncharacterized protein LOC110228955 isoform X1 [Arabidopsis lyrata subsp. lyrata]XP_020883077.1 uncharacterized protein LOC110228955 isoform X1 [Arabidopsis lyrata subsp. lyrata]|eukprot:XP_020883073.1 uncharacterized protein LOC110228954 isoform X1 [Arabidopsis lyrata subsp. lyrata]
MDPNHTDDLLNHLEKQNELLTETRKTMTQELQKLEVEEEMMMRKFYELMSTHRLNKKKTKETQNVSQGKEIVEVEAEAEDTSSTSRELIVYVRKRKKNQKPTQ